jgi:hypothetical protein
MRAPHSVGTERPSRARHFFACGAAGTNGRGKSLTAFERDAFIERHCELFGTRPEMQGGRKYDAPHLVGARRLPWRI